MKKINRTTKRKAIGSIKMVWKEIVYKYPYSTLWQRKIIGNLINP